MTSTGGTIDISASTASGLTVADGAVFTTSQGSVSGQLVNSTAPFSGTSDTGNALTDTNREAELTIIVADSSATNIDIQIDWQEGDPVGPVVSAAPGDSRTQIVQSTLASAGSGTVFTHEYENAPDPTDPSADINVTLSIIDIASGTINLLSGGQSDLSSNTVPRTKSSSLKSPRQSSRFLSRFRMPILWKWPSSRTVAAQQVVEPVRTYVVESTQVLNSSIGTSEQTQQRYYVLRIVTFGSDGETKIIENDQEYRLPDLEDPESESGFELSQLPELFERLPDDRYRIYIIEGEMERLVLDFVIRDGQPIESQHLDGDGSEAFPVQTTENEKGRGRI